MEAVWGFLLSIYNSAQLEYLSKLANSSYLNSGQEARDFIIKKLGLEEQRSAASPKESDH